MDARLKEVLARGAGGPVVVLTGAGISAESGIPTFRGPEGYWTVGSTVYHPQEMATQEAFSRLPEEVWKWYLYRRAVCRRAQPNPAHEALAALESALGDDSCLVTQNVDGLHLRAGSSVARTYQIHGNIDFMRCAGSCPRQPWPIPEGVGALDRGEPMEPEHLELLRCTGCGALGRPHVLWFDECYDEPLFRFESSRRAAAEAALLIIVGTSASTNLPWQVVQIAAHTGAGIVDINVADNPFGEIAEQTGGCVVRASASGAVPEITTYLMEQRT